jgi:pyruvate formate lyase activating enzyme
VETSGYANEEAFKECAEYIDTFLFDIKETDNEKHKEFTGKGNGLILKNLEYLEKINANVVLRCPVIPNCNDSLEHFENIGILAQKLSCVKSVELLPYHPLGLNKLKQLGAEAKYNEQEFLNKETAERFADAVRLNKTGDGSVC